MYVAFLKNRPHNSLISLQTGSANVRGTVKVGFANGGNFDNGLPFSLSMGCGTWGENNISDNLNYKHYLNITRIARTIPKNEPTEDMLFGGYRAKYEI